MLDWFYPISQPSNHNTALTTNFRINNVDISNSYIGIGTNSNIPVSQLYSISYFSNGQNIGNLFELNLPVFSGTINDDFKIWSPSQNSGLLIQILKSTSLRFNYNVDCSFVMVGGGGGGGNQANGNAGGGGGAGQLITGNIVSYQVGGLFTITIGKGGNSGNAGENTSLTYSTTTSTTTITAYGGGYGGGGKGSSNAVIGSSSGGTGSYSSGVPAFGGATPQTLPNTSIFQNMQSFNNVGALGNDQNNDSGAGGGGGGADASANKIDNDTPGPGGSGKSIFYGSTNFPLAGGGGGGGREAGYGPAPQGYGGAGGLGGGGAGGGSSTSYNGYDGEANTGGGGGGAANDKGSGGIGGSGTVIFYILPSGVSLP